jgi:hypothetical protein
LLRRDTREYRILSELLEPDEVVGVELVERRLGGAKWLGTAHAYATNHRVIIIRRYVLGLHNSLKIIKYSDITEVKLERGLFYCKIHFSLQGESNESEESKKWFMGLIYPEALKMIRHIDRLQAKPAQRNKQYSH